VTAVPQPTAAQGDNGMTAFLKGAFRCASIVSLVVSLSSLARAADYSGPNPLPPPDVAGVACDVGWAGAYTLLPAYWTSAWLGHFSGGRSHYLYENGVVALVWGDEKRCFPSYRACYAWVAHLRRQFHHPEGEWTCLPLR
jgi:hypothetical protein